MDVTLTIVRFLPVVAFAAWCLWGVDWRRAWPMLREGGWAPLVLIAVMAAVVWSLVFPAPLQLFGFISVPNSLWQLGAVALLVGLAFACGWLQGQLGWYPPEISFEPPAVAYDHEHSAH